MDLLSGQDHLDIRKAIMDLHDTFMDTPVTYRVGHESLDVWQEDRQDKKYHEYQLLALAEYKEEAQYENTEGANEWFDVMLTFNMEYLEQFDTPISIIDPTTFTPVFQAEKDRFVAKGVEYRVTYVGTDGPLTRKDCLVIVKGRKMHKESNG